MRRALTRSDGTPMCVLVVDQNAATRRVIVAILSRLGCNADVAGDANEAIDMFGHLEYDCILMDCQLPGMDGYAATRTIRGMEPDGKRIHIVAVAASAMPEDRQRAVDAGMDDFMPKPILIEELAAVLRRAASEPSSYAIIAPVELAVISDAALFEHVQQFLCEMMDTDEDVTDVIDEFVRQGHLRLNEILAAVERNDTGKVRDAGHALKGSLSYLGVGELTAMCRMMGKRGLQGKLDGVTELGDQISATLARIESGLQRNTPQPS